jgi:hypothetical protein
MDNNPKYASLSWIKNKDTLDDKLLYKLYATNKVSIYSGREYIALPSNKILSNMDYQKYDIIK